MDFGICLLSHDQDSFSGNPFPHNLFMSQSSPMDRTQRDLQLPWWPDTMSLRWLVHNQEPAKPYKVSNKAERLDQGVTV